MQTTIQEYLNEKEVNDFSPKSVINRIRQANWRKTPYRYQNWGNWLHRMAAFVGKTTPSMAYWLIKSTSKKGDTILDPFCGVGTIPLEADLEGRIGIGVDLNPYAFTIARAKFDRDCLKERLNFLNSIEIDTSRISLNHCSNFMKKFYYPTTLKEILLIRDLLIKEKQHFLLGCLLGIIHGHRPGHLSAVTSLVIPYDPKTKPEYKEVISRLKEKVKRMYRNDFNIKTQSRAYHGDARNLPFDNNSIDLVISSPPYFNTLDYVNDNRLRLEFLEYDKRKREALKSILIQDKPNYLDEMRKTGIELRRIIKKNGFCIFILGDLHNGKTVINTAEEVGKVYEKLGFKTHGIVDDAMPSDKCIPSKYKRKKLDRILIISND